MNTQQVTGKSVRMNGVVYSRLKEISVVTPDRRKCLVTPDDAKWALQINFGNRRIRKASVAYITRQIEGGEWQEDHPQPIVFSDAGRMIDGQHRMEAIILSNQSVIANCVFGCPDNMRQYIDTGINRTLEDRVTFHDDKSMNSKVTQIVNCIFALKAFWRVGDAYSRSRRSYKPTPTEAWEVFNENQEGIVFAADASMTKRRGVGRQHYSAALSRMHQRSADMAATFAASVAEPDGPCQPARMLRDYILRTSTSGGMMANVDLYLRSTFAMKAALEGREVKRIMTGERWM